MKTWTVYGVYGALCVVVACAILAQKWLGISQPIMDDTLLVWGGITLFLLIALAINTVAVFFGSLSQKAEAKAEHIRHRQRREKLIRESGEQLP